MVTSVTLKNGFKQTEIGVIPNEWKVFPITKVTNSIFLGLTSKVDYVTNNGIPLVRATDIADGHLNFTDARTISLRQHRELTKYHRAKRGDVLVSKSGSLGVCAIVNVDTEFSIYESIIVLQPNHLLDSLFLLSLLRYEATQIRMIGERVGSTVGHLNLEVFRKLLIPVPLLQEQRTIATFLSDTGALIESLEKLIEKKKAIKQGAMQQLLTGKKRLPGFSGKWEIKKLGDLVQYKNGKSFENAIVDDGEFNLITLNSIDITGKLKADHLKVKMSDNSLEKGDLIMVLSDVAHGNFLGLTDVITENNKYVLNQRMGALKKLNGVLPKFLSIYVNYYQAYFKMSGKGSSQQNLGKGDILKFEISLPLLAEQTAIATVLSDMDTEIESLEQKRDKYKMLKQGMMQQLLTGKIRIYGNN